MFLLPFELINTLLQNDASFPSVVKLYCILYQKDVTEIIRLFNKYNCINYKYIYRSDVISIVKSGNIELGMFLIKLHTIKSRIVGNHIGLFIGMAKYGHLEPVKFLVGLDSVKPGAHRNLAIRYAAENGHLDVVKFLASLDSVKPSARDNYAIRYAASHGHLDVVKFLASLESVYPGASNNDAIRFAACRGHLEVVKFLASLDSVKSSTDSTVINAIQGGHLDVVKFLISLSSSVRYEDRIGEAAYFGHLDVVKFFVSKTGKNIRFRADYVLIQTIKNGHLEIVKLLFTLDGYRPYYDFISEALACAKEHNQHEIVEFINNI